MKFSKPVKLSDGRYFSKISTDEDQPSYLQLNDITMMTPFSEGDSVVVKLPEQATGKLTSIDDMIVEKAIENSTDWFGKMLTEKSLRTTFVSSFKDDTMDVTKNTRKGQLEVKCYSSSKEEMDPNDLDVDTVCNVILQMCGIWFMKKSYGISWRLLQIKTKPLPKKKKTEVQYMFEDEEEPEESDHEEEDYEDYA